jgi:hypothetical protein
LELVPLKLIELAEYFALVFHSYSGSIVNDLDAESSNRLLGRRKRKCRREVKSEEERGGEGIR